MQYSPCLQNVRKDANRHPRGLSEGNKILEMKLKQLRQFWKIPLNALSSFLVIQTPLKICSLACCNSAVLLWVIFRANSDSEGFLSVPVVPSFAQRGGADCCLGSHSASERSTGCLAWDVGYWHIVTGDTLGWIYVWMLICVSGDCGSSMCSWDGLTTPLEASFLPGTREEARVWVWQLMGAWRRVKYSHPLFMRKILNLMSEPHTELQCWEGKSCSEALLVATALRMGGVLLLF